MRIFRAIAGSTVMACLALTACSQPSQPASPSEKSQKRAGPAPVAPLRVGAITITAIPYGRERGLSQNGGYIAASDAASGRELWVLKVYDVPYDARRERDVQDTFIVALELDQTGSMVLVRDELDRVFVVDPQTRTVRVP